MTSIDNAIGAGTRVDIEAEITPYRIDIPQVDLDGQIRGARGIGVGDIRAFLATYR